MPRLVRQLPTPEPARQINTKPTLAFIDDRSFHKHILGELGPSIGAKISPTQLILVAAELMFMVYTYIRD